MPACGSEAACKVNGLCGLNKKSLRARHLHAALAQTSSSCSTISLRLDSLALCRGLYRILVCCLLAPALWILGYLWLLCQCARLPFKLLLLLLLRSRRATEPRRCVLVGGGSSAQALRLTRSLSSAGARVLVCELEGVPGLARFSRACAGYHVLPRTSAAAYVASLRSIVRRERVDLYVPVSGSPARLDALAKPHLQLLGCECLVPGGHSRLHREEQALFVYWDPLPYCVYRCPRLPFRRIAELWGSRHQPPLAVVH